MGLILISSFSLCRLLSLTMRSLALILCDVFIYLFNLLSFKIKHQVMSELLTHTLRNKLNKQTHYPYAFLMFHLAVSNQSPVFRSQFFIPHLHYCSCYSFVMELHAHKFFSPFGGFCTSRFLLMVLCRYPHKHTLARIPITSYANNSVFY